MRPNASHPANATFFVQIHRTKCAFVVFCGPPDMYRRMPRARGQSLVEILVVTAIMTVVMGLVLSVFIQLIHLVKTWQH